MTKKEIILYILNIINDKSLSPLQIQKLFFLLEKRLQVNELIDNNSEKFNFVPYYYGPYDKNLSDIIKDCVKEKTINIENINGIDYFKISNQFAKKYDIFDKQKEDFIISLRDFIKNKSFKDLCFCIYKEFPEMAENSVLIR